jgi:hypothetical protein
MVQTRYIRHGLLILEVGLTVALGREALHAQDTAAKAQATAVVLDIGHNPQASVYENFAADQRDRRNICLGAIALEVLLLESMRTHAHTNE